MRPNEIMKSIVLFLLLSAGLCLGQTDTNLIATGAWSEAVSDGDGHTLRGRLLVYDDQGQSAAGHARVYLELQHLFHGGWTSPLEVYYNIGHGDDLHFEMRDKLDQPIPQTPVNISGMAPYASWVTIPWTRPLAARRYLHLGAYVKLEFGTFVNAARQWLSRLCGTSTTGHHHHHLSRPLSQMGPFVSVPALVHVLHG